MMEVPTCFECGFILAGKMCTNCHMPNKDWVEPPPSSRSKLWTELTWWETLISVLSDALMYNFFKGCKGCNGKVH